MNESKRQQIIDLINQYIYTNGRQRITAMELNQILIEIATSYALATESLSGGIQAAIDADPNVRKNATIINTENGRFDLDFDVEMGRDLILKFLGFNTIRDEQQGIVLSASNFTAIGNFNEQIVNPQKNAFASDLKKERAYTLHSILRQGRVPVDYSRKPDDKEKTNLDANSLFNRNENEGLPGAFQRPGVMSEFENQYGVRSSMILSDYSALLQVKSEYYHSTLHVGEGRIAFQNRNAYSGNYSQYYSDDYSHYWYSNYSEIFSIDPLGVRISNDKKLRLGRGATAGTVTMINGSAVVLTSQVNSQSVISLTVQAVGNYDGNVRVSQVSDGASFTISTNNTSDNCIVFWQIIEMA
ncbi:MAG: hypothetical protein J0G96_02520 [Flavobacteriia bacterium]|nr:hypothetical protein [Flavobacteriia bacterium]OJX37521.1 MAG: hypothetical protein BGO87_00740 [Flavobacteriia bacterium 40-80]